MANPGTINSTRAVDVIIQAVAPESISGASAAITEPVVAIKNSKISFNLFITTSFYLQILINTRQTYYILTLFPNFLLFFILVPYFFAGTISILYFSYTYPPVF
jgi:hypothetical protein